MENKLQKSEVTQQRILESALGLFAEKGYSSATMRDIAARSGCSVGLAYRYYRSKDAMVLALYQQLMEKYSDTVTNLEPGSLGMRWGAATRADLDRVTQHRMALMGLTSAGLTPGSATQVLGSESKYIRLRMLEIFEELVSGSQDLPRSVDVKGLATLMYGLHLLFVLFWLQDPTPNQRATASLVVLCEETMGWLRFLSRLPGFRTLLVRLSEIMGPIMTGEVSPG